MSFSKLFFPLIIVSSIFIFSLGLQFEEILTKAIFEYLESENESTINHKDSLVSSCNSGLILKYDSLLELPQNCAAYCETTRQVTSVLNIQNLSEKFVATVYVNPIGETDKAMIYTISSNNVKPIRILQNWNGSVLKVANISSENVVLKITLF